MAVRYIELELHDVTVIYITYILYTSQQEELLYTTYNLYSLILTIRNEQRH